MTLPRGEQEELPEGALASQVETKRQHTLRLKRARQTTRALVGRRFLSGPEMIDRAVGGIHPDLLDTPRVSTHTQARARARARAHAHARTHPCTRMHADELICTQTKTQTRTHARACAPAHKHTHEYTIAYHGRWN